MLVFYYHGLSRYSRALRCPANECRNFTSIDRCFLACTHTLRCSPPCSICNGPLLFGLAGPVPFSPSSFKTNSYNSRRGNRLTTAGCFSFVRRKIDPVDSTLCWNPPPCYVDQKLAVEPWLSLDSGQEWLLSARYCSLIVQAPSSSEHDLSLFLCRTTHL